MAEKPFRVLPRLTALNRPFWTGGADGALRLWRCGDCGTWLHPPSPRCPRCLSRALAPEAVSGRGTVVSFTLNHQPWVPAPDHPYAIALVELPEQRGLRLLSNVVGCPPEAVRIGMPVRVVFEAHDDVHVPLFVPAGENAA